MNIALIIINIRPYMNKVYFPIGSAYIATAMERAGYQFDIIDIEANRYSDEKVKELLEKKTYDVIAFGTLVSGYKYAKNIAAIARETNSEALIIAGNSVASSIPEHLLANTEVDIAVKGEGEMTMLNLLRAIENHTPLEDVKGIVVEKNGKLIDTGYEKPLEIDNIGPPHWELFDMGIYLPMAMQDVREPYPLPKEEIRAFVVNTARGCVFKCSFCYHAFQYAKYRYRTAKDILNEVKILQKKYGVNYINFFDELTFFSKPQIIAFVDEILASGIEFYWNADVRANLFKRTDAELLKKVKKAGCLSFGYSLESGNAEILKKMHKNLTVADFKEQKFALDEADITTLTSLVIGYPEETLETLRETFDVCYELNMFPSAGYLLPQPGTPMMEAAVKKGYVRDLEDYLMKMGDRQDLRFNLTEMADDVLSNVVVENLMRISDKLGLGIKKESLLKTYTHLTSRKTTLENKEGY